MARVKFELEIPSEDAARRMETALKVIATNLGLDTIETLARASLTDKGKSLINQGKAMIKLNPKALGNL